jgi:DNA-binding MarR family transcriptional regulator
MAASGRDVTTSRAVVSVVATGVRLTRVLGDALGEAGLTAQQFLVLMELASSPSGSLPLSELMARAQRSAPNMSALITRMARSGLVCKERGNADQRAVGVAITEAGWKKLEQGAPLVFSREREIVSGLTRAELREIARLLSGL